MRLDPKLSKADKELLSRAVSVIEAADAKRLPELIEAVREQGLLNSPRAVTSLGTLLHLAALRGNLEAVRLLLDAGAEVNARGFRDATPLMSACDAGKLAVMQQLVSRNADIKAKNTFGQTALHCAAGSILASPQVLEFLLAAGADPNSLENGGRTPLHSAVAVVDPEKVEVLLKAGADPRAVASGEFGIPLRYLNETVRDLPSTRPGQRDKCISLLTK